MRVLDLFCGAGGAAMGYHRAGFEVVGVDIKPQPNYPFTFLQADAMLAMQTLPQLMTFDLIHASPPCQGFTQMSARWRGKGTKADTYEDLLTPTREFLPTLGIPYVIENVIGAKNFMNANVKLHGGMFGLGVHRPRLFECSFDVPVFYAKQCKEPIGVYGTRPDGRTVYRYRNNGNMKGKSLIRAAKSVEEAQQAMGIDWMPEWNEIKESIPPAYTEYIGKEFIKAKSVAA